MRLRAIVFEHACGFYKKTVYSLRDNYKKGVNKHSWREKLSF